MIAASPTDEKWRIAFFTPPGLAWFLDRNPGPIYDAVIVSHLLIPSAPTAAFEFQDERVYFTATVG